MQDRVVVTGIGVISSIGIGKDAFWDSLIAGKSGITPVSSFDTQAYPTHNAGEVKDFNPLDFIDSKKASTLGRASALTISAARLSLEDSKIPLGNLNKERFGIVLGTTMGESQVLEKLNAAYIKKGIQAVDAFWVPKAPCNVLACNLAIEFGLAGPNFVIPTACAAGNYAIGYAYDLIRQDRADLMLAGGVDAFSRIAFTGFNRLFAVAPDKCQPFDKDRKGMMVGEGGAVMVIERLQNALKRKAEIYAEILGYGLSCDAHHMTAPFAAGIKMVLQKALKESKVLASQVDYISAHGTGTPANDKEECLAIHDVFGQYSKKIPISSIKSMLGHTMGAASAIAAAACCLTLRDDIIPPTINFQTPDPECDIDCVPNICRRQRVDIALNNALAFGGNNACLVLKKFIPA